MPVPAGLKALRWAFAAAPAIGERPDVKIQDATPKPDPGEHSDSQCGRQEYRSRVIPAAFLDRLQHGLADKVVFRFDIDDDDTTLGFSFEHRFQLRPIYCVRFPIENSVCPFFT